MNQYTIIGFNQEVNAIYATYSYNGHVLNHTVFVNDLSNPTEITQEVQTHYQNFMNDMDVIDAKTNQVLPVSVTALFGVVQEVSVVAGQIQTTALPVTPVQPVTVTPAPSTNTPVKTATVPTTFTPPPIQ